MLTNENEKTLLDKGYSQFRPGPLDNDNIDWKYQKRFDDEIGKKYYITVSHWRGWDHPHTGEHFGEGYEYDAQFTYCGHPVNLNFFSSWELDEAEEKIEELWQKCDFDYYEMFNPEERSVRR